MNNLIHIVDEESQDLTSNRYSIFTQNLMLAEMVSKHQHLTPRASVFHEDDRTSFHSAPSRVPSSTLISGAVQDTTGAPKACPPTPANIGRPRSRARRYPVPSSDWTWRPNIPERVSSMNTRRKKEGAARRPDLATFHRQSCQLFASLDSTVVAPTSAGSDHSRSSSTGTSPSLASSISTQATSILDDNWPLGPAFPSFHLELNPDVLTNARESSDLGEFFNRVNHTPRLASPRSSSQLSSQITTTEQMFWTSDASRETEYAKIDAAHTGLKGFVKRIFPRNWSWLHGKRRDFYAQPAEPKNTRKSVSHDTDSIRRFRISTSSQIREEEHPEEEDTKFLHPQIPAPAPPVGRPEKARIDLETGFVSGKPSKSRQVNKALAKARSSDALSKLFGKNSENANKKAKRRSAHA